MNRNNRLFINIVASIIATLVGLGIAFVLTPFLVAQIGKETYSFYPIASNLVNYFTIIVTAFNALASRFITIEIVKRNRDKAQEYSSSVLLTNVILASVFLIPMSFIVIHADLLFDIAPNQVSNVRCMFGLVFAAMLVNIIGSVYGIATFVTERIDLRSGQQIVISIVRVILYVSFFVVFSPNIVFVGVTTLCESIINFAIQYYWTKKLLPDYSMRFSFARLRAVRELFFSGIWSSISSLGNNLLSGLTLVFANTLFGATASGTLSIANTLPSLCTTIITMMINVFYPRLTNQYATSGVEGLTDETIKSERLMGSIISVPIILLIGMGTEFFSLWMPDENAFELQYASVIYLIPYVIQANMWTLTQVYPVMNRVRRPAIAMVILGLVNVIICYSAPRFFRVSFYFVPLMSTLFNMVYCVGFVPIYTSLILKCSVLPFYMHLLKASAATALTLAFTYFFRSCFDCGGWIGFISCGFVSAFVGYAIFSMVTLSRDEKRTLAGMMKERLTFKKSTYLS